MQNVKDCTRFKGFALNYANTLRNRSSTEAVWVKGTSVIFEVRTHVRHVGGYGGRYELTGRVFIWGVAFTCWCQTHGQLK